MISRNSFMSGLAVLAVSLTVAGAANAQTTQAFATYSNTDPANGFSNNNTTGVLVTVPPTGAGVSARSLYGSPALQTSTAAFFSISGVNFVPPTTPINGTTFFATFMPTGGTATFTLSTVSGSNSGDLLSGTFTSLSLFINSGSAGSVSIGGNGVVYTGGSYLAAAQTQFAPNALNIGNFSTTLVGINPSVFANGGIINNSFSAQASSGDFDIVVRDRTALVPEPSEYAFAAISGLSLVGLLVRARRTRRAA